MSRPEAEDEYSRTSRRRRAPAGAGQRSTPDAWQRQFERHRRLVLALGVLGALVLIGAELTPLLHIRTVAAHPRPVRTVQAGPHNGWALLPVAVAIVVLSLWASRSGNRLTIAAVGLLGLAALAIALIGDLPDAHATGLVGTPATGLHTAQAHAAIGLYLETLGAALALVAAAAGCCWSRASERRGGEGKREGCLPHGTGGCGRTTLAATESNGAIVDGMLRRARHASVSRPRRVIGRGQRKRPGDCRAFRKTGCSRGGDGYQR